MKALYRVSDGWVFNAPCNCEIFTENELGLIDSGVWCCVYIPEHIPEEHAKHYEIIDGEWVLLPEEKWYDYIVPEDEEIE